MNTAPVIEILIATMHRENLDFLDGMFPDPLPAGVKLLIVNQSQEKVINDTRPHIRVFNSREKGLSKSRNLALENAEGDLCLFTDDDAVFLTGFADKILRGFAHFPESAFIRFRYEGAPGVPAKDYPKTAKARLGWLAILNTSSLEMAIQRRPIIDHHLSFDEHFGIGSGIFEMGEEQVFLSRLRKAGLQLSYYPETLTRHESAASHQTHGLEKRYYIQGAVMQAIFNEKALYWLWLKIGFELKNNKMTVRQIKTALTAAKKGRQHYLNISS